MHIERVQVINAGTNVRNTAQKFVGVFAGAPYRQSPSVSVAVRLIDGSAPPTAIISDGHLSVHA